MEESIEPRDLSRGIVRNDQGSFFMVEILAGKIPKGLVRCSYGTVTRPKVGDQVLVSQTKEIVEVLSWD